MSILIRRRDCKHCKRPTDCDLVCNIASNGAVQVYWLCMVCKQNALGNFIPHEIIKKQGIKIEHIPVHIDYRGECCAVCGATGVELHHYAPKHLFGTEDSEKWPKGYLCTKHHKEWHEKLTPDMSRRKGIQ